MSSISLPSDKDERSRLLGELLVGDPEWTNDFFQSQPAGASDNRRY